jgi:hypothetical protein
MDKKLALQQNANSDAKRPRITTKNLCLAEYVPQGSILGPTLFIIYINDNDDNTKGLVKKFADDTKHASVDKNATDNQTTQEDINRLESWSDTWLLPFNVPKCKAMHLGVNNSCLPYYLRGLPIKQQPKNAN